MTADAERGAPDRAPATGRPPAGDDLVVARAVRAWLWTTAVLSALTLIANTAFGGGGLAAGIWVTSSIVVGLLVGAGWLVLSALLDMAAGSLPGPRRIGWTIGLFIAAFVSPILPAAMLQVAAQR